MGLLDNLLATGATVAGIESARDALLTAGTQAQTGAQEIGTQAQAATQFQPFAVTSTTGGVTTTPQGGAAIALSPQQQALQSSLFGAAGGLAGTVGQPPNPYYGQLANQAYGQAQGALGQVGTYDPRMLAQRNVLGGLFSQQQGQYGQPFGFEGLTGQALQQAQQRFGTAQQPTDINLLRGQFAGQVGTLLNQQPSIQLQALGQQAYGNAGKELFAQAPTDIEALRSQYAGFAGQAGQAMSMFDQAGREQDIYSRIRATQLPEEERQRIALQEQLASQGRLGVSTSQYGGTPEQLAQAKAQAEAQNQASLAAITQAGREQERAYQQALGLSSQVGQFAGLSSDIQTAAQARGAQLANLGMSADQIRSQLASEGLTRATTAAGAAGSLATTAGALEAQQLQNALGLGELGLTGSAQQQAQQTEQLNRLLGLQKADIGALAAQQALQEGQLGLTGGLFGLGAQASMQPGAMTEQQLANITSMLRTGYAPENQLLNALQATTPIAELADVGRRAGAEQYSEAAMSGLQALLQSRQTAADLSQQYYNSLASLAGSQNQQQQGMLSQIIGGLGGNASNIPQWLQGLIGGIGGGSGGNSISDIFESNLADYLGGSTGSGGYSYGGNVSELFNPNYTQGTPMGEGMYFGSGSGTGYNFGTQFDPYANLFSTGS